MLTNSIMAEKLNISITKIRRWTKEFLPPDPKATRRSGYTREFTENEGFKVILGGYMVSELGFSFHFAREMIDRLYPWMKKNGIVPNIPDDAVRQGIDKKVFAYEICFSQSDPGPSFGGEVYYNISDLHFNVNGQVNKSIKGEIDSSGQYYDRKYLEIVTYSLGAIPTPNEIQTDQMDLSEEWDLRSSLKSISSQKILPLDSILVNFVGKIMEDADQTAWYAKRKEMVDDKE